MIAALRHLIGWTFGVFRSRQDLILENLALRQQLLALYTNRPRRRLSSMHKLFWIALRRFWSGWKKPLILVTPKTVVAWHRAGFQLYWRWLSRAKRVLPGTDDADTPFWSPDSKLIGFFSHSKLKKVDPNVGQPEVICDAGADPGGATWNREGVIVFAPNFEGVLYRVPASGGQPVAITEAYKAHDETNHIWPEFLPDGRHFLFLVYGRDDQGIHVGSLDSAEHHLVLREESTAVYVEPGYLLFGRNGVLMVQRFDAKRLRPSGEPIRIVDAVESASGGGYTFSVSRNGVLVYFTGRRYNPTQLVWYRRDGIRLGTLGPVGPFREPRISPNGHTVAVSRLESGNEVSLWLIDSRGVPTRFTFGDFDLNPIWSPASDKVIFSSPRDGLPPNLFQKSLAGGSEERRLMHSGIDSIATDWSCDGRYVVYMANELGTNWNIWALALTGDQTSQPVLRTQFNEMDGRVSPDGHWLAYVSDESGKWEVMSNHSSRLGANGKSPAMEASSRSGPTKVRNSSMWLPTRN